MLSGTTLEYLSGPLGRQSQDVLRQRPHGDSARWLAAINHLPELTVSAIRLDQDAVTVTSDSKVSAETLKQFNDTLMQLHPWRKGPFDLFGTYIDSEWRSNLKWRRISKRISPLTDRMVLDVGCGNGYYLWRMLGAGARIALGIDPTRLFLAQFAAVNRYINSQSAIILPFKSEEFLCGGALKPGHGFDTVFSMGVYYHRRKPMEHLRELLGFLRPGGELVLETLILQEDQDLSGKDALMPESRYAQMRNVWRIPKPGRLISELSRCGFENIEIIDITPTTALEQRKTRWMQFDSLTDFLDPQNAARTIEGYPAPVRACLTASRPKSLQRR